MEIFVGLAPSFLLTVKIMISVFLLVYIIFAIAVVKQVRLMTITLQVGLERHIKFIAYAHLAFSVIAFILSAFVL